MPSFHKQTKPVKSGSACLLGSLRPHPWGASWTGFHLTVTPLTRYWLCHAVLGTPGVFPLGCWALCIDDQSPCREPSVPLWGLLSKIPLAHSGRLQDILNFHLSSAYFLCWLISLDGEKTESWFLPPESLQGSWTDSLWACHKTETNTVARSPPKSLIQKCPRCLPITSSAHPVHAGVSEPIHPALCLCLDRHLLCHTRVPRGPPTPRCGVLLHPEVLPSGIQVTAAFPVWWVEVWDQG